MSDHQARQMGDIATVSGGSGVDPITPGMPLVTDYSRGVELTEKTSQGLAIAMIGNAQSVLEVGAADGVVSAALIARGCTVTAIEPDASAIDALCATGARALHGTVDAVIERGDLEGLAFDVILCGDVLEHVADPVATLRSLLPFLSADGRIVASLPNVAHIDVRLALLNGAFPYSDRGLLDRTHLRFFTRELVDQLVEDCGLVLIDMRRTYAAPFCSELGLRPEDFDPALVNDLRAHDEAETYQFVFTAVRLGADTAIADALSQRAQLLYELHSARLAAGRYEAAASQVEQLQRQLEIERQAPASRASIRRALSIKVRRLPMVGALLERRAATGRSADAGGDRRVDKP